MRAALLNVAILFIPVKLPEDVVLRLEIFSILLLFTCNVELTAAPITIPLTEVVVEVEAAKTRMLFDMEVLPIRLLLTCVGAAALFI